MPTVLDVIHRLFPRHGLILPGSALDDVQVQTIAEMVARRTKIELFISGTHARGRGKKPPENRIYAGIFYQHKRLTHWSQSKHHRWRLDSDQICRYHFGDHLDPKEIWWESIGLPPRTCTFYVFAEGAVLAALVCEDLARIDPAQVALRAVGPNLVVALLMDGPQLAQRWPARYATVLADDPGSAVLTLTSLGMVRRSVMPGDQAPDQVALWKGPFGRTQELKLPANCHGLVLTLSKSWEEDFVWDGRSDEGATVRLQLSGVHSVRDPRPPSWIATA